MLLEDLSPIGCDTNGNPLLRREEYFWLIEQAEKVEQLEQEIASLKEALNASVKTSVALDNELQQEQAKIERCKEIFKDIREASRDIYALLKAEQALQALEGNEQ